MFGYCIQIDVNIKIVIVYKAADILSPDVYKRQVYEAETFWQDIKFKYAQILF